MVNPKDMPGPQSRFLTGSLHVVAGTFTFFQGPQSRFLTGSLHPASVTPLPIGSQAASYAA